MNRLTKLVEGIWIENHDNDQRGGWKNGSRACMTRLAEYENTGLTPEEIYDGKLLTGWVPIAERLPKENEMQLVSCKAKNGVLTVNRAYYLNDAWHGSGSMSGVVAWMPLPEPYAL